MAKKQNTSSGEDVLLNVRVTGADQITDARGEASKLNEETKKAGNVDMSKGTKSLKSQLREATVEAQRLFAAGQQNTKEYAEAAKKVTSLKNDIDELNNTFKAFDPDNKFRVFSNAAAAGAKAVQGYAGAMAFLGVNSESATETIAKLQGIMAFADAIDSLGDLKDSYNDLIRMLGLTETAAAATATATVEAAAVEISAEEQLAAARLAVSETSIAAEEALLAVRAQNIDANGVATVAERTYLDAAAARAAAVTELAALEGTLANQTNAATVSTEVQAVAMEGVTVAEEGAAAASFTLGAALKAIGIGLIISLIAYLVTNWKEVKKAMVDLFPALGDTGKLFDKLKVIFFGVGNAIIQFLVTPIKTFIKLVKGDFKGAMGELAKGADFAGNYAKGAAKEVSAQLEEARKERVKKEIEANERIIKERKALGQSTLALEVANKKREISLLDAEDEDYAKDKANLESEITVMQNAEYKKRSDAYRALLKADLDKIREQNQENLKLVKEGSEGERKVQLTDIDIKYQAELTLLNKRKQANVNYHNDLKNLLEARKIEEQRINKKYDDAITEYENRAADAYSNEFELKAVEINKRAEELLANATNKQKAAILATQAFLIGRNTDQSLASNAVTKANTNLADAENINRANENDTPAAATAKINALAAARLAAEDAAYNLRKAQLEGQYLELELLEKNHEKNRTDITTEQTTARKDIAKAEAEAKLKLLDVVANAGAVATDLLGENTVAGKAMAVATTGVSTYLSAQQAYASQLTPGDPTSPFRAALAAGVAVAAGLANVKKILSVKIPGKTSSTSSSISGGGSSAPVINSTVLNQDKNGSQDVAKAINDKDKNAKPLRAFIVNKDLEEQKAKTEYFNSISNY